MTWLCSCFVSSDRPFKNDVTQNRVTSFVKMILISEPLLNCTPTSSSTWRRTWQPWSTSCQVTSSLWRTTVPDFRMPLTSRHSLETRFMSPMLVVLTLSLVFIFVVSLMDSSKIDRVRLKPYNMSSKLLSFYKVPPEKHGQIEKSLSLLVLPWEWMIFKFKIPFEYSCNSY